MSQISSILLKNWCRRIVSNSLTNSNKLTIKIIEAPPSEMPDKIHLFMQNAIDPDGTVAFLFVKHNMMTYVISP